MKKILVLMIWLLPAIGFSQETGNYLILNDIGEYKFRPNRVITIGNAGILVPTGHFPGHGDMTYEGIYIHPQTYLGVTVKVTKHTDPNDSLKWLLHEVERDFRNYYGIPALSYSPETINGRTVLLDEVGGRNYRWLSNNKVIVIEYVDLQMTKPSPYEIINAYLAKHPSTLPAMTLKELRSTEGKTKWIKDEMERRLWLGDKWFYQLRAGKAEQKTAIQEAVKSMEIFLNYREKYYGIASLDEKKLLWDYRDKNDGTSLKSKLTEYKNWWTVNKDKAISL